MCSSQHAEHWHHQMTLDRPGCRQARICRKAMTHSIKEAQEVVRK
jgi:hypothetical protein